MTTQSSPVGVGGGMGASMDTDNITSDSSDADDDFGGATIVSPILMFLAGVLGNILALLVIRRTRVESQRLMFHSLVGALVWNDLLGIILTTPVTVAAYVNNRQMPGGEHLCRFNGLVMVCFGLSTPLIVGFMAVERFLFVKHTFFYTKHCAPGAARSIVFALWGFTLFFGLLPLLGFGEYVLQYPKTWCFLNFSTAEAVHAVYGYLYSSVILILVLVMVACNLVVVLTLARVRQFRRKHSTGSLNSVIAADGVLDDTAKQQAMAKRKTQKDIELQMIVVVCAITAVFIICWVPLMVYGQYGSTITGTRVSRKLHRLIIGLVQLPVDKTFLGSSTSCRQVSALRQRARRDAIARHREPGTVHNKGHSSVGIPADLFKSTESPQVSYLDEMEICTRSADGKVTPLYSPLHGQDVRLWLPEQVR
ncbi:hypothetical protein RRG08_003916 [Elysia crispata]|uniref:G-protein coupled receptors family 1 profile domain-containing protein n=1 Tax=Elysia crispata TaxID=231223 RepID=A0AAE0YTH4_9GAST|nr:hypothetical protein RRG08_003916 [Elysia crispata]